MLALSGTNPDRGLISHRLWAFYSWAAASGIPEGYRLAETIEAWWPAIEAAITTGYPNARSEGYNRLAKHVGRNAFGFRTSGISVAGYAGPAPANTGECQPRPASCPPNSE